MKPGEKLPVERLAHRYRFEAHLGHGGMGSAYRARDEASGALVAVKFLSSAVAGCPEPLDLDRFMDEARAAATKDPGSQEPGSVSRSGERIPV